MQRKNLSFHPKLAAVLDLACGLIFWMWMGHIKEMWALQLWMALRVAVWIVLVWLVLYVQGAKRWGHFFSLLLFLIGSTYFFLFIENKIAWDILAAIFVVLPAASFWLMPVKEGEPSFMIKPYRRWRLMMTGFGLAGMWSGIFAYFILKTENFYPLPIPVGAPWLLLCGTMISGAAAFWWWREYGAEKNASLWTWFLAAIMMIGELSWVIYTWPVGYFVGGLLLTWLWYIIWIMARFHLSPQGINWKKQAYFLASNGIFIFLFLLLIVRWR